MRLQICTTYNVKYYCIKFRSPGRPQKLAFFKPLGKTIFNENLSPEDYVLDGIWWQLFIDSISAVFRISNWFFGNTLRALRTRQKSSTSAGTL